ncbi:MAG: T9SS type A sorting domain-containing protein [Fidelibacterota bacterium]
MIALNPTIIVEDCDACAWSNDCFCLIPEFLDHAVPTLIIAGQNEVDELPDYDGLLGGNHYDNTPETTIKMLYEIASGGHGSAASPVTTGGQPAKLALHWLNYFIKDKEEYCDSLIVNPENASRFVTTIDCNQGPPPPPSEQNIGYLRETETSFCMDQCSIYHLESEGGDFLYNISNQNNIPNFEYFINRFVEIEGDTIQCVECSAVNVNSIFLSNECEQPVSCFVEPCTVSNCSSSDSAECSANYCGGCYADYYQEDELITCESPGYVNDLSGVDFGLCDMALGFAWVNNHCGMISGCGYIVNDVNYSTQFYSSLFDCISASTLKNENEINPSVFRLYQNHPNPFNPSTQIRYQLSISGHVKIAIYNTMGKIVKTLANEYQTAGFRSVNWDGKNNNKQTVSSGVYFYSIQSGEFSSTKKMILLD